MQRIYLDNNATTRLLPAVQEAMNQAWENAFANPGSQHSFGRDARRSLEDSREEIATLLDADPSELVFTSGGTEAINMAVHGLTAGRTGTLLLTAGEHPATVQACLTASQRGNVRLTLPVESDGLVSPARLNQIPWDSVRLVCVILAHNETGIIQNTETLAAECERRGIPLLLDAVQAVGKIPVSFRGLRATALAFGAHKFHGPRGIGGLLIRNGVRLPPLLEGGHQEAGRRAGTEPVPLIVGMASALREFHNNAEQRTPLIRQMRDRLQSLLQQNCGPVAVHGEHSPRLPNTLSIAFPGVSGEALLVNLHLAEVACSLGSTCASGSAEPAPALLAMGIPPQICTSTVRFSLSIMNSESEMEEAARRISECVNRVRGS
ncbi:MAG: cysteine desulfurase [Planctomycetaceae bacterium]|nr:cysteine desulfurase [Planctomycetaceae bacterium]